MQESFYLGLDAEVAKTILDFFSPYKRTYYKKGEIIMRSEGSEDYTYCSSKGFIVTYSISPKGHRDVRTFSRPYTIFPISNFFIPPEADIYLPARPIYFEALTDVYVWRAPAKDF